MGERLAAQAADHWAGKMALAAGASHVPRAKLRRAAERARMAREWPVMAALVMLADPHTSVIQPASSRPSASYSRSGGQSSATLTRWLGHWEAHGWLSRERDAGRRGRPVRYRLAIGQPCACPAGAASR